MRVLMLGWEFPPHISGGLGTACLGISKALVENGVEVVFVVPRLHGDEPPVGVELLSAAELEMPEQTTVLPESQAALFDPESDASGQIQPTDGFELRQLDSPLRPYMTEYEYAQQLERLRRSEDRQLSTQRVESQHATALLEAPPRLAAPRAELHGGYGPDLFAEVERYAAVVRELATREKFDVIHAHDWMTFPAGIAAANLSAKPLVLHVHASEYDRSGDLAHPGICRVEQRGFDRAERVICVSEYNANLLRKNYVIDDARLQVIHNAVTRTEQRQCLKRDKSVDGPIVLFLGRITYQKGPDYFLEAAARVLKIMPEVRFVLSGSGDMWPKMVERAAQLGISERTHFTGFLKGDQVERMFAMADLYVMPSVSEPFGISTLEAMALDVPTIISRQSGVAEVLHSALKVDFWDVEDLANKILALLRYPALTDELSESGRLEVERMNWKERGHSLLQVYEAVTP